MKRAFRFSSDDDRGTNGGSGSAERTRLPYGKIPLLLLRLSARDIGTQRQLATIASVTGAILVITVVMMYQGINVVFPHLFYIPIIMAAYWFPRHGIIFSFGVAAAYISLYMFFSWHLGTLHFDQWAPVASRSVIYIAVGSFMTILRWEAFTLNRIISGEDKFIFIRDKDKGYFYYSPSVHNVLGPDEVSSITVRGLSHLVHVNQRRDFLIMESDALRGGDVAGVFEVKMRGEGRRLAISLSPIFVNGKVRGYQGMAEDVTELKDYEESLEKAVEERTVLLAELHHRVRNNLAMIVGMLNMQMMSADDEAVRNSLRDAEARIMSMSSIHGFVFQSDDFVRVDINSNLNWLLRQIVEGYGLQDKVRLETDIESVRLDYNKTTDLSIVVTELLTNSINHAFSDSGGRVVVSFKEAGDEYLLEVIDDGPGVPEGFRIDKHGKLGLKVAKEIVEERLEGMIWWSYNGGMRWSVSFPKGDV